MSTNRILLLVSLPIKTALLCAALAIAPGVVLALDSAGGTIGNDDKELSGLPRAASL